MKRAHTSGKLKGKKKRPVTRKQFVKLLEAMGGDTAVQDFYEMIEPLDKEVAELRMEKFVVGGTDKLGKKLDAQIEQNEMLYDRLMLALDGERPPKGILFTVEALAPFAAAAEAIGEKHPDMRIFDWNVAEPIGRRVLTFGNLRDAAKSYEHFIGRKPR